MKALNTNAIIGAIFGAILVFYLIANTFEDAASELTGMNDSYTGVSLLQTLLPLFLVFGVVFAMYKLFGHGGK